MIVRLITRFRDWKHFRNQTADKYTNAGYRRGCEITEARLNKDIAKLNSEIERLKAKAEADLRKEKARVEEKLEKLEKREKQLSERDDFLERKDKMLERAMAQCQASKTHFDNFVSLVQSVVGTARAGYNQVDHAFKELEHQKEKLSK